MKGTDLSLAALFLSAFVAVCPLVLSSTQRESYLVIDSLRRDRVDGSYTHPKLGYGIVFNATKDALTLSTLSGNRLLSTEERVGPVRLVTLGKREFVQHSNSEDDESKVKVQDFAIPKYHGQFKGTRDHETLTNLVGKLKKLDPEAHSRVLKRSVKNMLSKREINLLSDAAVAMGRQGITSQDYPSALPLFMTASRLIKRSVNEDVQSDSNTDGGGGGKDDNENLKCLEECPPCQDEECLGLCGPGCECWEWACGNCCYNKGCYYHDLCCRSQPDSLACMLPMEFDCDTKYECK